MTEPSRDAAPIDRMVVGLGNPGPRYAPTRHNVGFRVVDHLAARLSVRLMPSSCGSLAARHGGLLLVQPQTYMNRSGYAVRCWTERLTLAPAQVLIVYDDIHLPLGRLRLRRGGSAAGQKGIASVLENLGTDGVPRLRLGVADDDGPPAGESLVDFVLATFPDARQDDVDAQIARASDASLSWAQDGIDAAMQQHNG
ncbi:MAG: aminoacyl-tRNA hydrolase [Acidobacteriota bacterium]